MNMEKENNSLRDSETLKELILKIIGPITPQEVILKIVID